MDACGQEHPRRQPLAPGWAAQGEGGTLASPDMHAAAESWHESAHTSVGHWHGNVPDTALFQAEIHAQERQICHCHGLPTSGCQNGGGSEKHQRLGQGVDQNPVLILREGGGSADTQPRILGPAQGGDPGSRAGCAVHTRVRPECTAPLQLPCEQACSTGTAAGQHPGGQPLQVPDAEYLEFHKRQLPHHPVPAIPGRDHRLWRLVHGPPPEPARVPSLLPGDPPQGKDSGPQYDIFQVL
mmetsp:Transcript_4423/g.12031  ORF Transcript_4423/g.12031 Transcript_4423/m.12031 type:complete len:240 (+) Transcript_4423:198-917(+)